MNWSIVKLILGREIRDQLRDRRTLFMIAVLPILLYPLLGMSFFQVMQFMREHAIRVLVVGAPDDPQLPPLVDGERFAGDLFSDESDVDLLKVKEKSTFDAGADDSPPIEMAERAMREGPYDVVVYFPPDFSNQYRQFRESLEQERSRGDSPPETSHDLPDVGVYPNLAEDASSAGYRRVSAVLSRWRDQMSRQMLEASHVPPQAAKPFKIATRDVAKEDQHVAAAWSKILPFVLLIWALTGAFYPAIDICAGEKERGTLETLLSSPAERLEIVWGKLLTVMLFSMATAILNLTSLGITGSLVLQQVPGWGPPPLLALVWLAIALVPMSALFAALCLALAALARSTKEGQYYLMPLVLVTMPLTILPMAPGVELNLGNSLIPITGVVLLLRAALEGHYLELLPYLPVVVFVTLGCCLLAIRWATDQFNSEGVLFRESERWGVRLWLRHLVRDRTATPSFAQALFAGVLILMLKFFMGFISAMPASFADFAKMVTVTQLVVVLTPAVLAAVMLTRSPGQTLLLRRPAFGTPTVAVLLAVALHPTINLLEAAVRYVYPLNSQIAEQLSSLILEADNVWLLLLVIAVIPAICEELAFRGFILSGLRHMGHKWTAIVVSSVMFGATHAILQQSIVATLIGVVLGFIAVQSGSLVPCVLFHAVNNSMAVLVHKLLAATGDEATWTKWIFQEAEGSTVLFQWPVLVASLLASGGLLYWLHRLPYVRTPEESLQEAIDQQSAHWLPG
ncbi:MAG: CPBP family intramembrane metalloprotease [Planctomycetota bacterium]|nr:MAG: CPBP family intramembrane metalloprotease [Planctomycetota bacterium]